MRRVVYAAAFGLAAFAGSSVAALLSSWVLGWRHLPMGLSIAATMGVSYGILSFLLNPRIRGSSARWRR